MLQRKRGSTIGLALSFGLLAFACVVVFGGHFVKSLFGETTAKTNEPPPMPSIVPPVVDSAPSPTPIASGCPATCCGGTSCVVGADNSRSCGPSIAGHCRACSSGRSCVPGACESRIDASATWLLRIAGVTQNGKDIYPRPDICMRVTGTKDWTCTPGGNADPKATRLKITTTELTSAGIDIRIEKKPKEEVSGTGISHAQVGVAALCKGLNFRFTGADKGAYAATLFLDDEE